MDAALVKISGATRNRFGHYVETYVSNLWNTEGHGSMGHLVRQHGTVQESSGVPHLDFYKINLKNV